MQAILNIRCISEKQAKIISIALNPETIRNIPRTKVEIHQQGKQIILSINASQISSLRAACNSYLRWIHTAISVSEIQ